MQAGILNRQHLGVGVGFVVVGVPVARRGHEGCAGLPIFPVTIADHSVIKFGADQQIRFDIALNLKIGVSCMGSIQQSLVMALVSCLKSQVSSSGQL